ncbi:hypothetical protein SDJN03_28666, partial [Cucurbita argyrosperma subsp. sororia]
MDVKFEFALTLANLQRLTRLQGNFGLSSLLNFWIRRHFIPTSLCVSESYFKKETSIYKVIEAKFGKNMDRREKIEKRNQSYKR